VTTRKFRTISLLLCLALLAAPLAGCGRKTDLDTPTAGAEKERKRLGEDNSADTANKPASTNQLPDPFHKQSSFILDPAL
jgi:predicted small lipoprotein YifL